MQPVDRPFNKPPAALIQAANSTLKSQVVCYNNVHRLYWRILEQAIYDLFDTNKNLRDPAWEWFWSADDKYPWNMIIICQHIQLDPDYVKHIVQQLISGGK
jgi:hypothetical protein